MAMVAGMAQVQFQFACKAFKLPKRLFCGCKLQLYFLRCNAKYKYLEQHTFGTWGLELKITGKVNP